MTGKVCHRLPLVAVAHAVAARLRSSGITSTRSWMAAPTICKFWLCHVCHERAHEMHTGGLNHRRLMYEGIARAKLAGKYKGRKPTVMAKADTIRKMRADGINPTYIARQLGVARSSVYRVLSA